MKCGVAASVIHQKLCNVWNEEAPSLRTVQRWVNDFGSGVRVSFDDGVRSGRPRTSGNSNAQKAIQEALDADAFLSCRQLAEIVGISKTTVCDALHEMQYRNVYGMWVPHVLTPANKADRKMCAENLIRLLRNTPNVEDVYAVQDETWIYFDYHSQRASVHGCPQVMIVYKW